MTDAHESRPGGGGLRFDPNDSTTVPPTSDDGRPPRWTGCPYGCGPDRHEPGCWVGRELPGPWLLEIDRGGRLHWRRKSGRGSVALDEPRRGGCVICGYPLDAEALRARDTRCTRCYRQFFALRRTQILGRS